jgi:hypothetical protein
MQGDFIQDSGLLLAPAVRQVLEHRLVDMAVEAVHVRAVDPGLQPGMFGQEARN